MSVTTVTFEQLKQQQLETCILDTRDREEVVEQGQLATSHCIPLSEVPSAITYDDEYFTSVYGFRKPALDDSITTMCYRGGRGRQAAQLLADNGFTNVQCYEGSFHDWQQHGGHILRPGQPFRHTKTMQGDVEEDEEDDSSHVKQ